MAVNEWFLLLAEKIKLNGIRTRENCWKNSVNYNAMSVLHSRFSNLSKNLGQTVLFRAQTNGFF